MHHQSLEDAYAVAACFSQPVCKLAANSTQPMNEGPDVVTSKNVSAEAQNLKPIIALLDQMDVLSSRRTSLDLIAFLAEHVGTPAVTVAELMLISARVSKLAELLDDVHLD